jgi:hypothetical protein
MRIRTIAFAAFLLALAATTVLFGQPPHSVTVSWSCPGTCATADSPTGFQVQRSATSGGPYATVGTVTGMSTTSFVDTVGLVEGATYFYVIQTTAAGGAVSANSTESNGATIPFSKPQPPVSVTAVAK